MREFDVPDELEVVNPEKCPTYAFPSVGGFANQTNGGFPC